MWDGERDLHELLSNVNPNVWGYGAMAPATKALQRAGLIVVREAAGEPLLWHAELTSHGGKKLAELSRKFD